MNERKLCDLCKRDRARDGGSDLCEKCYDMCSDLRPSNTTIDPVNNPQHYKTLDPEPITVIESWGLDFHLGNALKYIARAGKKGDELEDLRKADWYLKRKIDSLPGSKGGE